jgi:hypothetical protein
MSRKTVEVNQVIAAANRMLEQSVPEYTAQREGIAALLERVLFDTGNYHGYAVDAEDSTRRTYK